MQQSSKESAARALGIVALLLATAGSSARAQTNPLAPRGLSAPTAYQLGNLDAVSLYAGNLTLVLPLGPAYPVSEQLSYRFQLYTNSNLWTFESVFDTNTGTAAVRAIPDLNLSNAGLGWQLSFGRMLPPNTPPENNGPQWVLLEPDATKRAFWDSLHAGDPVEAGVYYTRDGSYLRMRLVETAPGSNIFEPWVESPDGTTRIFRADNHRPREIHDPWGNWVRFAYTPAQVWTITDSVGRQHTVQFQTLMSDPSGSHVSHLTLAAFGGTTAIYGFQYEDAELVRPVRDTDTTNNVGPGNPPTQEGTESVPLLRSVSLPDGSSFAMDYVRTRALGENPGMIRRFDLPTGGRYEWSYAQYWFPEACDPPLYVCEDTSTWGQAEGVAEKRVYEFDGTLLGTWLYERKGEGDRPPSQPPVGLANEDPAWFDEVTTWVTDPLGHQTVHYFPSQGKLSKGLPFTPFLTDSTGTRFLSREVFDGPAATAPRLRSEYVRYTADELPRYGENPRIESSRTVYHDDSGRFADSDLSDFDGLGHYRQSVLGGNFPSGNVRSTFTAYNPTVGTWGQPGFSMPVSSAPWVLSTFSEQAVTEGGQSQKRETCFDPTTGVLLRERLLAGATPSPDDVLSQYTYEGGFMTLEEHFGGDGGGLATAGDSCSVALPAPRYVTRHTSQNGVRAKSETLDGSRVLVTFLDLTIDANTGLTAASRDPAGQSTFFDYDSLGRVVREEPPEEAPVLTSFQTFAPGVTPTPAKATVTRVDPLNEATELQRAEFTLDGLGRLVDERYRQPGGGFNQRRTEYDAAGNQKRVSELQNLNSSLVQWNSFENYDPFGRAGRTVAPDSHSVEISYAGVRSVVRTIQGVATSTSGAEQPVTTSELYDRQGRLVSVSQASGPSGESVTTAYTYDVGNRLTEVTTTGVEATQVRRFTYDGRGFLLSEEHPEIDGTVLHSESDPLGRSSRERTGLEAGGTYHTDLTLTRDAAGRVVRVGETGGRVYKEFSYALSNVGGDARAGKLVQAKRHNWVPDPANPGSEFHRVVTETFVYSGPGGRLSLKHLRATDPGSAAAASFTQSFEYDLLGVLAAETYPVCVSPRCERYGPPRTVSYERSEGVLTAVPGWVNSISYHPNGLVSQIQHFTGMIDTLGIDPNAMRRPGSISFAGARSSLSLGSYSYDGAGNLKSIGTDLFAYDGVSRLTEANLQSVTSSQSYTFDSFGNLTSITTTQPDASGQPLVTPRSIGVSAATNRLTASPYDAAGNVTSLFTLTSLAYDPFNRVTHLTGTGVNKSFLYTADDLRVGVIDHQAQTEDWTLRGLHDKVVRSYRKTPDGWQWQQDWVYRDGLLAGSSEHEKWRQYHLDHLGSPRLVTGPATEKIAEYHPFPFGEMAVESGVGVDEREGLFRYTGHERDTNCEGCDPAGLDDLDYMHARFFSAHLGRFMSPDPVRSAQRSLPQSWNRYSYTYGNPLSFIDPDGETVQSALQLIAQNAGAIHGAAALTGGKVAPIEIARVLFQENRNDYNLVRYNDNSAVPIGGPELKNLFSIARFDLFGGHGSFGIGEMRTDTAAKLFGWDPDKLTAEQQQQVQEVLSDPVASIILVAAYLSELKRQRPNAPTEVILSDYNRGVSDSNVVNEVGGRSGPYLGLIQQALDAGVNAGGEITVIRCGNEYKFSNQCEPGSE